MKKLTIFLVLFTSIFSPNNLLKAQNVLAAGCSPPTAQLDLDIANVKARILNGGDMWWDAINSIGPKYEVPKGSGKHSLFTGALWIGGVDASNNLRVAAQTYRQGGVDFWPGPLDTTSASVTPATCLQYDHLWKINKQDVINFIGGAPATNDMLTWPGNGTGTQPHFLAPFHDVNGDGIYNPADGDYPEFGFNMSTNCCDKLHGDQAIWWVINDVGGIHASGGAPLGIEIRCQAYAYNSSDVDISNTTFYQYTMIYRASTQINQAYFGLFTDADLGNFQDDYIGCDVPRGLGYTYNGDNDDDGPTGYGLHPPAVGIDFLQGPLADDSDGVDNNRNCIIDEPGESMIMSKFVYVPQGPINYYSILSGAGMTYGGNGYGQGNGATNIPCSFMLPGSSDHQYEFNTGGTCTTPAPPEANWDEYIAGNVPGDRRFLASIGPFTLEPGAVHCITVAAIWARDTSSSSTAYFPSVAALQAADDKIQAFFDTCFYPNILGISTPQNFISKIFPNPVNDILDVQLNNIITEGTFSIYDVTGRVVNQVALKHQQKFSVSCKDLSRGIYVYRILLPDGKRSGGKFIKE